MPRPKSEFDGIHPCDFYTPAELMEPDELYTIYEIARMLQGLEPDADIDDGTEAVLLDWAVPWVMVHAEDLVVGDPTHDDEPGHYGLRTGEQVDDESAQAETADEAHDDEGAPDP